MQFIVMPLRYFTAVDQFAGILFILNIVLCSGVGRECSINLWKIADVRVKLRIIVQPTRWARTRPRKDTITIDNIIILLLQFVVVVDTMSARRKKEKRRLAATARSNNISLDR